MKNIVMIISVLYSSFSFAVDCKEITKTYDVCGEIGLIENDSPLDLEDSLYEKVLLRDEDLSLSQVENNAKQINCTKNNTPASMVCLNLRDVEKKVSQNFIEDLF